MAFFVAGLLVGAIGGALLVGMAAAAARGDLLAENERLRRLDRLRQSGNV